MAHKHHGSGGKKQTPPSTTQIDQTQVEQQLTQYHQIASALHLSTEKAQAEVALAPLTNLSEGTQIAFLKAISKERTIDAADITRAMNTLAPIKEVRKEAHRSLIRLEETRIYPQWIVPTTQETTIPAPPARFWKGLMTNTRGMGEMQLILCWEQGVNYQEVRMMGFLLEFWHDGVKDFFTEVNSKRHIEGHLAHMRSQFVGLELVDCTLAKGHQLIDEALQVNKKHGTKPHKDYTRHLSLIHQLILETADTVKGEGTEEAVSHNETDINATVVDASDEEELFSLDFESDSIVPGFIESWVEGDFETTYDLLASTSPLREGLSRKEWAERRRQWSAEAHPRQLKPAFIHMPETDSEQESPVVEIGWSLAFDEVPLASPLKELPVATLTYKETGRHWFWSSYTLVREDGAWVIQEMTDEGANALQLPPDELQKRLAEIVEFTSRQLEEINKDIEEDVDEDEDTAEVVDDEEYPEEDEDEEDDEDVAFEEIVERFQEMLRVTTQALHYNDSLITQLPSADASVYLTAYDQAIVIQEYERAAVYMELMAERFPEQHSEALRKLAVALISIANQSEEEDERESVDHFLGKAETILRDSLTTDNVPMGCILLAETLIAQNKQLDEAKTLLQQTLVLTSDPKESTLIEGGLAKLAEIHDDKENALIHYQRAAQIRPDFPGVWFNIGNLQHHLNLYDEAIQSFLRSIEEDPHLTDAYIELAGIYSSRRQFEQAQDLLEEGIDLNPDAADLFASLSLTYIDTGDLRNAEAYLEEAEELDAEDEFVQTVRQIFDEKKSRQRQQSKSKRHKAKKR